MSRPVLPLEQARHSRSKARTGLQMALEVTCRLCLAQVRAVQMAQVGLCSMRLYTQIDRHARRAGRSERWPAILADADETSCDRFVARGLSRKVSSWMPGRELMLAAQPLQQPVPSALEP